MTINEMIKEVEEIEAAVADGDWALYLECLDGMPIADRFGDEEIEQGARLVLNIYVPAVGASHQRTRSAP
jgi:hypothetical protein